MLEAEAKLKWLVFKTQGSHGGGGGGRVDRVAKKLGHCVPREQRAMIAKSSWYKSVALSFLLQFE